MSGNDQNRSRRKSLIIGLGIAIFLLFLVLISQQTFNLTFLRPGSVQQTLVLTALSALVFLLFVALTFVLLRNLLKPQGNVDSDVVIILRGGANASVSNTTVTPQKTGG